MALRIEKETKYGINVLYWKIAKIDVDWMYSFARIYLYGFKDKEARENNKTELVQKYFDFSGENFTFTPEQNLVAECYNKLKETNEFRGAEDA